MGKANLKPQQRRLSITLPIEIVDHLRERSEYTGLSMSVLAAQIIKKRKHIFIISQNVIDTINAFRRDVESLKHAGNVSFEVQADLKRIAEFYEKLISQEGDFAYVIKNHSNFPG